MFKKVAEIAYQEYNAVVFALEIELKTQPKSIIRLNPSKFEFIDWHLYNYYLYLICEDESVSKRVQKFEMQDDKYERMIGKPRIDKNKHKDQVLKQIGPSSTQATMRKLNKGNYDEDMLIQEN